MQEVVKFEHNHIAIERKEIFYSPQRGNGLKVIKVIKEINKYARSIEE